MGALFALVSAIPVWADCPDPEIQDRVRVRSVYDGDTLTLADHRKIRLIGFNTPELGRDGRADEPLALEARDELRRRLFLAGQVIHLQYGAEHKDHYGRILAHGFTPDGENLGLALLRKGLAMAIVIPPDLWGMDCYQEAEQEARRARRGLWAHSAYQPRESRSLGLRDTGFLLVQGRVEGVERSGGDTLLRLEGRVSLRVPRQNLGYFPQGLAPYAGQRIEARGWFRHRQAGLTATIQHPAMITRLTVPADAEVHKH